jgi:hypothetical protein
MQKWALNLGGRVVKDNALTGGTLAWMSQLEPMMAEENKNADSYDRRDGVSNTCIRVGKKNDD